MLEERMSLPEGVNMESVVKCWERYQKHNEAKKAWLKTEAGKEWSRNKAREYYARHREEVLAKRAERYANDRETILNRAKEYYSKHSDEINAMARAKRAAEKDEIPV